jgi:DNA repair protein RadA/Sms
MLCAILEKRCDIYCSSFDIFVNIVGGLRVKSTSVDMPLAASLLSSILGLPLPPAWAFIGEIGLGGEIRDVPGMDILIKEGVRLGLSRIFIPQTRSTSKYSEKSGDAEIVKVKRLDELREQIAETNIFETNARKH